MRMCDKAARAPWRFGEEHSGSYGRAKARRHWRIAARPPMANWGVSAWRAATLSDGLPDVPASRRSVFCVGRRPANIDQAQTELIQSDWILL